MVKDNLIPPTEEVRYLNTEIPSYEEFLKNHKVDERVKASYESEIDAYAELEKGYGPMPKWWCINCKGERDHYYDFCQRDCHGNCYHVCKSCRKETLASYIPNALTTDQQMIVKEMIASAQQQAIITGQKGEIEITRTDGSVSEGNWKAQILVYNTDTGKFVHHFVTPVRR